MTTEPLARARFPHVAPGQGHYESWYLKLRDPSAPRALWLRHTVHQRPGRERTASLWLTLFDATRTGPPRAGKQTFRAGALRVPGDALVEVGPARLDDATATGALASPTLSARWELALSGAEPALTHLPLRLLYAAPLPRTKALTSRPALRASGVLHLEGDEDERLELDGWLGVLGHNWGAEHAERWIWLHAGSFLGRARDSWIDATLGRIAAGGRLTPWVANGALALDGERLRLGGPRTLRATRVEEDPTGARFVLRGAGGVRVEGELRAPREQTVAWRYADPVGPEHHTAHSSLADLRLEVRRPGRAAETLEAPAAATYELGMRETDHGLPVQPYADGEPDRV